MSLFLQGKGHEDYQEIEGKKYPMDERVLIQEILEEDREKGEWRRMINADRCFRIKVSAFERRYAFPASECAEH